MSGIPPLFSGSRYHTPPRSSGNNNNNDNNNNGGGNSSWGAAQKHHYLNMSSPARSLSANRRGNHNTSALYDALVNGALAHPLNPRGGASSSLLRQASPSFEARRATPRSHELASIDLLRKSLLDTTTALEDARAKNHELLLRNEHLAHEMAAIKEHNSTMLVRHAAEMAESRAAVDRTNERLRHMAHREEEARAEAAHWRRRAIDSGIASSLTLAAATNSNNVPRVTDRAGAAAFASPIAASSAAVGEASAAAAAAASKPSTTQASASSSAAHNPSSNGKSDGGGAGAASASAAADAVAVANLGETLQYKGNKMSSNSGRNNNTNNNNNNSGRNSPSNSSVSSAGDSVHNQSDTDPTPRGAGNTANNNTNNSKRPAEEGAGSQRPPPPPQVPPLVLRGTAAGYVSGAAAAGGAASGQRAAAATAATTTGTRLFKDKSPSVQAPNLSPPRRESPRLSDSSRRYIAERIVADSPSQLDLAGFGSYLSHQQLQPSRRGGSIGLAASPKRSPARSSSLQQYHHHHHLTASAAVGSPPSAFSPVGDSSWAQEAMDLEDQMEATKARLRSLLACRPL